MVGVSTYPRVIRALRGCIVGGRDIERFARRSMIEDIGTLVRRVPRASFRQQRHLGTLQPCASRVDAVGLMALTVFTGTGKARAACKMPHAVMIVRQFFQRSGKCSYGDPRSAAVKPWESVK